MQKEGRERKSIEGTRSEEVNDTLSHDYGSPPSSPGSPFEQRSDPRKPVSSDRIFEYREPNTNPALQRRRKSFAGRPPTMLVPDKPLPAVPISFG